jgi:hypothetical protein
MDAVLDHCGGGKLMTPNPAPSPLPSFSWWQSLIVMAVNVALGILGYHFGGPVAGAAVMAGGTGIAHQMQASK